MSQQLTTYSGRDANFTLNSPLTGTIQASGVAGQGIAQISIEMTVIQTTIQVGMDGSTVPSAVPGDQGVCEVQVWQTSAIHKQLLQWYNALKSARDNGDVSQWAASTLLVMNIVDGTQHQFNGVAPERVPNKVYAEQAGRISWRFLGCNVANQ